MFKLSKQTDGNAMGLVITNYGFFGNNFVSRAPSMEYPLGSQIDHLIRAGLWIGGINAEGDTVVSSGTVFRLVWIGFRQRHRIHPLAGHKRKIDAHKQPRLFQEGHKRAGL